jgi:hypothetical protein
MKRRLSLLALGVAILAPSALAQGASPEKSIATIKATFEVTGGGTFVPGDGSLKRVWSVKDTYVVTAETVAQKAGGWPAMHAKDAALQKSDDDRQAAANKAATNMAPMMAQAEAIMQKCGDDEDCMMRESMKMAQGMDKSAVASARKDVEAVTSNLPGARYQLFQFGAQTGTFTVAETLKDEDRDPICIGMAFDTCQISRTVTGSGPITLDGKARTDGTAMAEIDLEKSTLKATLPMPWPVDVKEVKGSDKKGDKSGTFDDKRYLTDQRLDLNVEASCPGGCKKASGVKTYDIKDQLTGRPAKLKVTWTFERK